MGIPFRITKTIIFERSGGAGTEFQSIDVVNAVGRPGTITAVQIRRDAGDGITTAVVPFWVTNENALTATPADDDIVVEATSVALSASATVASLQTAIDNPDSFSGGLRMGGDFALSGNGTSTTIWTVSGEFKR